MTRWFEVDRAGLRKLLEQRGVGFILTELVANAWDAPGTTHVEVTLEAQDGSPRAKVHVADDSPGGFTRLEHAWTLFAESERKADPLSRGRWDIGEKLVLSMCEWAEIISTTGGVRFDVEGRHTLRRRTERGSTFTGMLRLTHGQADELAETARMLIAPAEIAYTFNGETVFTPQQQHAFETQLATETADEGGVLRRSRRIGRVEVHTAADTGAWLYELGIPVVATELPWTVNVLQKVPLTLDRTNVAPGFLRDLRVALLAQMAQQIPEAHLAAPWVKEACASPQAEPQAVATVLTRRFGERSVAYDPSDTEGSKIAMSEGYTVVPGGTLSAGEWANARRANVLLPAGQVTPSPRVLSSPDGEPPIPEDEWTESMCRRAQTVKRIAKVLLIDCYCVRFHNNIALPSAWYGCGTVTFNLGRLSRAWCDEQLVTERVLGLIIHELAHELESDHLSSEYHEACCHLGARAVAAALADPALFKE